MIVDAQVHLWRPDSPEYPWPADCPVPPQGPPLDAETMIERMDRAGVDRALVVPPVWTGDDNVAALEWAQQYPDRLAVMGRFDLWNNDRSVIDGWLNYPGMLGVRLSFEPHRGTSWFDPDAMTWFWTAADELGLPIMFLTQGFTSDRLGALNGLAQRYPRVTFVIDHLGLSRPQPGGTIEDVFANFPQILGFAEHPNVCVKWSSLPFYSYVDYPFQDLDPYLADCLDAYGAHRIMWGSDATRVRHIDYRTLVDHARFGMPFLDDEQRALVLGGTATEVLGWPESSRGPRTVGTRLS